MMTGDYRLEYVAGKCEAALDYETLVDWRPPPTASGFEAAGVDAAFAPFEMVEYVLQPPPSSEAQKSGCPSVRELLDAPPPSTAVANALTYATPQPMQFVEAPIMYTSADEAWRLSGGGHSAFSTSPSSAETLPPSPYTVYAPPPSSLQYVATAGSCATPISCLHGEADELYNVCAESEIVHALGGGGGVEELAPAALPFGAHLLSYEATSSEQATHRLYAAESPTAHFAAADASPRWWCLGSVVDSPIVNAAAAVGPYDASPSGDSLRLPHLSTATTSAPLKTERSRSPRSRASNRPPRVRVDGRVVKKVTQNCHANSICANCKTDFTTLWRRNSEGRVECNACNLYERKNGVPRPEKLRQRGIMRRTRNPRYDTTSQNVSATAS